MYKFKIMIKVGRDIAEQDINETEFIQEIYLQSDGCAQIVRETSL